MINSVYGKTMENVRKRIKVRLVKNDKDYKIYIRKASFVLQKFLVRILLLFMRLNQF